MTLLTTLQVLDSSFAQQPPSYQAAKRRSTAEGDKKKPGKKQQRRSKTPSSGDEMGPVKIVRSPSGAAVHVSPIAPSMKMKANPSFSKCMGLRTARGLSMKYVVKVRLSVQLASDQ